MTKFRLLIFLLTILFVGGVGFLATLLARGWRLDTKTLSLRPKGLFVATSVPDGAQIILNGKLESATNATIPLPPDTYEVELKKEGFYTWKKTLTIKKEEVTKVDTYLFPLAPSLSALTFTGAIKPSLASDRTKLAYGVEPNGKPEEEKVGIWIMELVDLPIGFSKEPRRVTDIDPTNIGWKWSPDARTLLITTSTSSGTGAFLADTGTFTPQTRLVNLTEAKLREIQIAWKEEEEKRLDNNLEKLPQILRQILKNKAKNLSFSPDQNKILYTAQTTQNIPEKLIRQLPGSSTQKEERNIKDGRTYVYDIKEDRNFFIIDAPKTPINWFPTSNHVVLAQENKVTIADYDGTNQQVVWSGTYEAPWALPSPNPSRLLILTNLGADKTTPNLYALSLR